MAYEREHVKERIRPKSGKLLDQARFDGVWFSDYPSNGYLAPAGWTWEKDGRVA
jgi:hypothetical protein